MPTTGPEPGCVAGGGWRGERLYASDLCLRAVRIEDVDAIVDLAGDWEVARTTARIPHPLGHEQATSFITNAIADAAAGREHVFAVERLRDGRLIGCAGFRPGCQAGVWDIGYWIGRPFWGRGYATQAVRRLARLLFQGFGAERLTAAVMSDNGASARVLEKAGFVATGVGTGCEGRCAGQPTGGFALDRAEWQRRWGQRRRLLVVAVALVDADGRVLLAQRPEGGSMPGLWEFPGGKVADGELPAAALVRELNEELAIDTAESCLAPLTFAAHDYEDFHLLMPLFACRVWRGDPVPQEGQDLRWVRPNRLADLPMPPADVPLAAMVRDLLG